MQCDIGCKMERIEQLIRHAVWSAGSRGVVIGISGGIDSAVAAVLCSRALGGDNVLGICLPSAVTQQSDVDDGTALCRQFGIRHDTISIEPMLEAFRSMKGFESTPYLVGNLMARIRMTALYYHANKNGMIVCGTSNKSEYLLGYSTKYGDGAADLQPILHLFKTEVYDVAGELGIPDAMIEKVPSAGLYPGQSDEKDIGFTYEEIDNALRSLESNDWKPELDTEEAILQKLKSSVHKRVPPPNLLMSRREPVR